MTWRDSVANAAAGFLLTLVPACGPLERNSLRTDPADAATPPASPPPQARARSAYSTRPSDPPMGAEAQVSQPPALSSDVVPRLPPPRPIADRQREPSAPEVDGLPPSLQTKSKQPDDAPLIMALRCFLNDRPAEAVDWLKRYDKSSEDLLLCLLPLAARLAEKQRRTDPDELAREVKQLVGAADLLRSKATFSIENLVLCRTVDQFGKYVPLEDDHGFRPHDAVHLYAELQNVSSEQTDDGYAVRLSGTVEIRQYNGDLASRQDFPETTTDTSRSPRHDFFNVCSFSFPRIPPGRYTLTLKLTDVPTRRACKQTLDIRVTEPGER